MPSVGTSDGRSRQYRDTARGLPRWELISPIAAIVAAVIAGVAGFYGAQSGADAAITAQELHVRAADDRRTQSKRAEVYEGYLDAAVAYLYAAQDIRVRVERNVSPLKGRRGFRIPKTVIGAFRDYGRTRSAYQTAVNELFVYGSDAGWQAHLEVATTLPPSMGTASIEVPSSEDTDAEQFTEEYRAFLVVVCQEVAAEPRPGCDR